MSGLISFSIIQSDFTGETMTLFRLSSLPWVAAVAISGRSTLMVLEKTICGFFGPTTGASWIPVFHLFTAFLSLDIGLVLSDKVIAT
ncbi:hypothetical protein AYI68_g4108 [Smittium mucronatum]|uniref:Uncharacterized protein n=1 Tax=Smittium mucronatum TaxID=133383 RepID=A0A1R0GY16_9FUNG|nr:hypothetical protein AYI68_g4108 [Smittium mucronatum]